MTANLPEIRTARLRLRPLTPADLDEIHRLWTDEGVRKYLWDDEVISREKAASVLEASVASFEAHGLGLWAVHLPDSDEMIGFCGYMFFHDPPHLELLYGLAPGYLGKGLATEMVKAMTRYGFEELSLDRVEASADVPNQPSVRVMERVGMKFRKRADSGGHDTVHYVIRHEDFQAGDEPYELRRA